MIPVFIVYTNGPGRSSWNLGNLGFVEPQCYM